MHDKSNEYYKLAKKTNILTSPIFGIFSIPEWNLSMTSQKVN